MDNLFKLLTGRYLPTRINNIIIYANYQVPHDEDRRYLLDQRNKEGPRGSYQLGPVDRVVARRNEQT